MNYFPSTKTKIKKMEKKQINKKSYNPAPIKTMQTEGDKYIHLKRQAERRTRESKNRERNSSLQSLALNNRCTKVL